MSRKIDMLGEKIGRLTVIASAPTRKGEAYWLYRCECGKEKEASASNLRAGNTMSCGCLKSEKAAARSTTHGMTRTPLYIVWASMRRRCEDPKNTRFKDYGGRGIKVCDRWKDFANFYADMGDRPPGTSIERINNDLGYFSENCRWATRLEQANNCRSNRVIAFNGQRLTVAEWSRRAGMGPSTIAYRLKLGWSPERAVSEPPDPTAGRFKPKGAA